MACGEPRAGNWGVSSFRRKPVAPSPCHGGRIATALLAQAKRPVLDKMLGPLSRTGSMQLGKDQADRFFFSNRSGGDWPIARLDRFCPSCAILAGWADLRCKAAWGAIAVPPPPPLRCASAAPATPAAQRNAMHHARCGSATTFAPAAFAASRSSQSAIFCASGCSHWRFVVSK